VIRTQRRGRWGKWHKATTWTSNDAFWITACGMSVFKRSSVVGVIDAANVDDVCRRCSESLHTDRSVTTMRFASVEREEHRLLRALRAELKKEAEVTIDALLPQVAVLHGRVA
jgi:hypothetical protein